MEIKELKTKCSDCPKKATSTMEFIDVTVCLCEDCLEKLQKVLQSFGVVKI